VQFLYTGTKYVVFCDILCDVYCSVGEYTVNLSQFLYTMNWPCLSVIVLEVATRWQIYLLKCFELKYTLLVASYQCPINEAFDLEVLKLNLITD
jgi:hypothetical protein